MTPPGRDMSKSTNEVIHGLERDHVVPVQTHRTLRERVSSMPSMLVSAGGPRVLTAVATRMRWTVAQPMPCSAATSLMARLLLVTAALTCTRNLLVNRDLDGS